MKNPKITIVMPAYNAAKTLEKTYMDIPKHSYDEIILVDDASHDETVELAKKLNLIVIQHALNLGYGGNQKTCYKTALERGADIIVMLHPDNQYDPRLVPNLALPIIEEQADVVLASRFIRDPLKGGPVKGGMPLYKFVFNKLLTGIQNMALGTYFSEFHTGYRAFSRKALMNVPFDNNSDNFIFDNQLIVQLFNKGVSFKEIPVETRYFPEASSVNFLGSIKYGLGVLGTTVEFLLYKKGLRKSSRYI